MKIQDVPFTPVDWAAVPAVEHKGETGSAFWRTVERGNLRVRMVEYTPGYSADHWCPRGHVILVLKGELHTRLNDGREFTTRAGQSWHVADNDSQHRSSTTTGATLFIVD